MGLGDFTEDKKVEHDEVSQEELQQLIEDVEEYNERVKRLLRVIVNMDKRVQDVTDDMEQLHHRIKRIEKAMNNDSSSEGGTEDEDEDNEYSWQ